MLTRVVQITGAAVGCIALLASAGCANCAKGSVASTKSPCGPTKTTTVAYQGPCEKPSGEMTAELPRNAKAGDCFAKVFIPPEFKTVTERVLVKEASERLEIVPAKYEWVEERVCVRDAEKRLVEEPAEFAEKEVTVQVNSGHTDWEINKDCLPPANAATKDVFCLVNHPPEKRTLRVQCQTKPPQVREETIPAEYEIVRRHKLVSAATTKKVCIPAEYETVEKTVKVCDGRMAWQRVDCEKPGNGEAVSINANGKPRLMHSGK